MAHLFFKKPGNSTMNEKTWVEPSTAIAKVQNRGYSNQSSFVIKVS